MTRYLRQAAQRAYKFGAIGSSAVVLGIDDTSAIKNKTPAGLQWWLELISNGQIEFPGELNYGIGGATSVTTTGGYFENYTTKLDAMATAGASGVFLWAGGNNDARSDLLAVDTIARYESFISAARDRGLVVLLLTPNPVGSASFTSVRCTSTQMKEHMTFRSWCLDQRDTAGVLVFDTWPILADPASTVGDCKDASTYDGLHRVPSSCRELAQSLWTDLLSAQGFKGSAWRPASNSDTYTLLTVPRASRITNPMVDGSSAGSIGTNLGFLATGYFADTSGVPAGKLTFSKTTGAEGNARQQVEWASDIVTAYGGFARNMIQTGLVAGDEVFAACDIEWDSSISNIKAIVLILKLTGTGGDYIVRSGLGPRSDVLPSVAGSGYLKTPKMAVPASMSAALLSIVAYPANTGAVSTVTFRARNIGVLHDA